MTTQETNSKAESTEEAQSGWPDLDKLVDELATDCSERARSACSGSLGSRRHLSLLAVPGFVYGCWLPGVGRGAGWLVFWGACILAGPSRPRGWRGPVCCWP